MLEGSATARLAGRRSHFTEIPAGSMLMLSEGDTTLPAAAEIRLARLRQTSGLLSRPFESLPADPDMQEAIDRQEKELSRKRLISSNIKVRGSQATLSGDGGSGDSAADSGSSSSSSSTSSSGSSSGGSSSSSSSAPSGGGSGGGATGAIHCVGCASHATPIGAVSANDPLRIAQIRAGDAAAGNLSSREGPSAPGVKVSASISLPGSETASRGDLDSVPAANTITVSNSSDLNALAHTVILASFRENITVANSSFTRQPGVINIDAGTIVERTLSLNQSTFTADVIKARSFNTPGSDALLINGGAFNGSQLIRLYAEGGGRSASAGTSPSHLPTRIWQAVSFRSILPALSAPRATSASTAMTTATTARGLAPSNPPPQKPRFRLPPVPATEARMTDSSDSHDDLSYAGGPQIHPSGL